MATTKTNEGRKRKSHAFSTMYIMLRVRFIGMCRLVQAKYEVSKFGRVE